jgi:hypothetical protein
LARSQDLLGAANRGTGSRRMQKKRKVAMTEEMEKPLEVESGSGF